MPFIDDEYTSTGELRIELERLRGNNADLLEALQAMYEEFASNFPDGERTAVDMARAAIAKATGEHRE